jgi:hypothetical protein
MRRNLNRRNFLQLGSSSIIAPAIIGLTSTGLSAFSPNSKPYGDFRVSVHGTAAIVEFEDRPLSQTLPDGQKVPGIWRRAWGTEIIQGPNTENWIHFPITANNRIKHGQIEVIAWMDFGIIIDKLELWSAEKKEGDNDTMSFGYPNFFPIVGSSKKVSIRGLLGHDECGKGLNISIHVIWKDFSVDPVRRIIFHEAGIIYDN